MNWDYLAGFLDADGHFQWQVGKPGAKQGIGPRIVIGQKDRAVLDAISAFLISEGVTNPWMHQRPSGFFTLNIARWYDVEFIISKVLDKLIVKHQQAGSVLTKSRHHKRTHNTRPVPLDEVLRLVNEGYTGNSIAKILGFGRNKIVKALKALDIHLLPGGRVEEVSDGLFKRALPKYQDRRQQRLAYVKRVNNRCAGCSRLIWPASTHCKSCATKNQTRSASS